MFDRQIALNSIDSTNIVNMLSPIGAVTSSTQTITMNATGGTFTIAYKGISTNNLSFNASAATVQAALQGLASIGAGNVTVTLLGNVYTLTFTANNPTAITTDSSNLTGSVPTAVAAIVPAYTITANPTVPGSNPGVNVYPPEYLNRVFRISFPVQQFSGSYSLVVGPVNNVINPTLNKTITDNAGNAIDNNLNAGLYVLRGTDPTNASTQTHSYSTPIINQTFLPGGAASSTITVPDDFIITQDALNHIQLQLTVNHQNVPDLVGTLTGPDGTTVTLFTNDGINGAIKGNPHPNISNALLDDFAPTLIQNAAAPIGPGSFKPQTPLSVLIGKNARGTWTLTIANQRKNAANPYSIGTFTGTLVQWSLALPFTLVGTGLGEQGADQINVGFRIFTEAPTNSLSTSTWTAIGPASQTSFLGPVTGSVGAIVVDPADTSGNTVYAAGSKGGIWKTYNFLTSSSAGPNWIPLTDLGPLDGLNINALTAIASPDGDPNKTLVIAGTGTAPVPTVNSKNLPITNSGVGFLRSPDGGRTWQVIDSLSGNASVSNGIFTVLPMSSPSRQHQFVGTAVHKVVIDPTPLNGQFVMYAAIEGTNATNSGVFRSIDSGFSWTQLESGLATDVVLAGGSAGSNGLLQYMYAGFMTGLGRTGGVYSTSSASSAGNNSLLPAPNNGSGQPGPNQGVNSRLNVLVPGPNVITVGASANPSGTSTPVILATPGKTNNPLEDALYRGWVYAYTNGALFETKDFGQNWTQVNLPFFQPAAGAPLFPTNDTTRPVLSIPSVKSIVIDPKNPNIIYIGGGGNSVNALAPHLVRVDLTAVSDVYSFVNNDLSDPNGVTTVSPTVGDAIGAGGVINDFDPFLPPTSNVLSMLRDPSNPFLAPSSLNFTTTTSFRNDGSDIKWQPFDFDRSGDNQVIAMTDPVTGETRLLSATVDGAYTAVVPSAAALAIPGSTDPTTGEIIPVAGIGSATLPSVDRTGNLQVGQMTTSGVEPSTLAADIAGAFIFSETQQTGIPMSDANIFQNGNLTWGTLTTGWGEAISADPTAQARYSATSIRTWTTRRFSMISR